ncbi:MAG: ATP-binding cassette domain-containing protein [Clostridia bacterium]|jgi:ABC-type sugar transport system ATPase subunit|nr:ATP-binding cassette domain-containing protein [Clostridia bacterium]MDD4571156.1 ATP-binding cassette domain-containing protein [Clostridia bacterium]
MIALENFSVNLGQFYLKNINIRVAKGEIFAILGATGAGKTVILEALAGLYTAENGAIYIDQQNVSNTLPEERNLGYVHQDYSLFPHLSVYQNIEFGLKIKKIPKTERLNKVKDISHVLGIEHLLSRYPRTLSGGEQQRTALARALVMNPKILLMDEPFSALDCNTKERMYDMINMIHERYGCTIIFVTHDLHEAKRLADRVAVIQNGELKMICSSCEIQNKDLL